MAGTSSANNHWKGNSMEEICRGFGKFELQTLPSIQCSDTHKVLFELPLNTNEDEPPKPHIGKHKWDSDHVRLPCAKQNTITVDSEEKQRWTVIESVLSKPIKSIDEFEEAILTYNPKYANVWKFVALHELFQKMDETESNMFFDEILPSIIRLALRLPTLIPNAIPLLKQDTSRSISMTQEQVACLLANAFLCTFPRRNTTSYESEFGSYPSINFAQIYQKKSQLRVHDKLKCIIHYFRRISQKMPSGVITIYRRSLSATDIPDWSKCEKTFDDSVLMHVTANGTIEDGGDGLLQVDFANRFLGGGVLGWGCVQEEIRFVICPELICTRLFVERMDRHEAVFIMGCERFSSYTGYAQTFKFTGDFVDETPRDQYRRRICTNLAIDAMKFRSKFYQFEEWTLLREINKAYVGFLHTLSTTAPAVATGNWGCGAYNGDKRLKSLIQLIVCCVTNRPMVYFTFYDAELCDEIDSIFRFLTENRIKIGDLWCWIIDFKEHKLPGTELYQYIFRRHKEANEKQSEPKIPGVSDQDGDHTIDEQAIKLQSLQMADETSNVPDVKDEN